MLHVIALITAKPGQRAKLLEIFQKNVPTIRTEPGCIEYGAAVDADGFGGFKAPLGSETFVVIEKWESPEALKTHGKAPHMASYMAAAKDLIAERSIHVLSPA